MERMEAAQSPPSIPPTTSAPQAGARPTGVRKSSARRPTTTHRRRRAPHETRADFKKDGHPCSVGPAVARYHAVRPHVRWNGCRSTWANYVSAAKMRIERFDVRDEPSAADVNLWISAFLAAILARMKQPSRPSPAGADEPVPAPPHSRRASRRCPRRQSHLFADAHRATSALFEPMKAPAPISVLCLKNPS